jgi:hypothetical protein
VPPLQLREEHIGSFEWCVSILSLDRDEVLLHGLPRMPKWAGLLSVTHIGGLREAIAIWRGEAPRPAKHHGGRNYNRTGLKMRPETRRKVSEGHKERWRLASAEERAAWVKAMHVPHKSRTTPVQTLG